MDIKELHPIQTEIIKKLMFTPTLRYSNLRPFEYMENNQLNFHLKQLQNLGIIKKEDTIYQLTNEGKELAGRLDTDASKMTKQAKISAWVGAMRIVNDQNEFLIYTRRKTPFYGCQGFLSGKVRYGEKVIDAAKRELFEETGLQGEPEIMIIKHYRVFAKDTFELLEDKFMYGCMVKNPTGVLTPNEEGEFNWIPEGEITSFITNPFESIESWLEQLEYMKEFKGQILFTEDDHVSEKF